MLYCDPWNPVPFQSRPGLLNDPNAYPNHWDNYGCFDQVSVPPVYIVRRKGGLGSILLVRKMQGGAGSGGSGEIEYALLKHAQRLFGERLGATMWHEFRHQEFCWNRGGTAHGGGMSKGYAIWEQFPNPAFYATPEELKANNIDPEDADALTEFFRMRSRSILRTAMFFGANIAHYKNVWLEDDNPPSPYSVSVWQNPRIPYDPDFDPDPYDTGFGYPVWAIDCIDIGPNPWGRYAAPDMLQPMVLPSRKQMLPIRIEPFWC